MRALTHTVTDTVTLTWHQYRYLSVLTDWTFIHKASFCYFWQPLILFSFFFGIFVTVSRNTLQVFFSQVLISLTSYCGICFFVAFAFFPSCRPLPVKLIFFCNFTDRVKLIHSLCVARSPAHAHSHTPLSLALSLTLSLLSLSGSLNVIGHNFNRGLVSPRSQKSAGTLFRPTATKTE